MWLLTPNHWLMQPDSARLLTPNHWLMQPDVIDVTVFESQNSDHNRHTLLRIWHSFKTASSWESRLQNKSKKTAWKRLMQPRRVTTTMARITITMAPKGIRAMASQARLVHKKQGTPTPRQVLESLGGAARAQQRLCRDH